MNITFLPQAISLRFKQGETVLDLAEKAGVPIDGNCGGSGTCGKCIIKLIEGNIGIPDEKEIAKFTSSELRDGYRLACRFKPLTDTVVLVTTFKEAAERKSKLFSLPDGFIPDRGLSETRIGSEHLKKECYGVAFDIGTTTVSAYLWDLSAAKLIGTAAEFNPQGLHGADVISRIAFAAEKEANLRLLHKEIIDCLNYIAVKLADRFDIKLNNVYEYVIVGNTTMSHLFLGINPAGLAFSPFSPAFKNSVSGSANGVGLAGNVCTRFYLMPNIAGHVGSDITAGILATDIIKSANQRCDDKIHILIDIGTNGEIVLAGNGRMLACSTAAGPAFEGASIYQGMRASDGAIEKVRIDEDVEADVIGGGMAKGICGSGIIDAVSQMIRLGLIDKTGKLIKPEYIDKKEISEAVRKRFRKGRNGEEFVLAFNDECEDIVITQKDIREVQLAKAAIRAGINIMLMQMDSAQEDILHVHLAGIFGRYINIESALTIGLLPGVDRDRIVFEGNAAGVGAAMALLSKKSRKIAEKLAGEITHVELTACSGFSDEYLKSMEFD